MFVAVTEVMVVQCRTRKAHTLSYFIVLHQPMNLYPYHNINTKYMQLNKLQMRDKKNTNYGSSQPIIQYLTAVVCRLLTADKDQETTAKVIWRCNSFCKPYIMQYFLFTCLNTNINIKTLLLAYYHHLFLTNHRLTPFIFFTFQSRFSSQFHYITHSTLQIRYRNKHFSHPHINS